MSSRARAVRFLERIGVLETHPIGTFGPEDVRKLRDYRHYNMKYNHRLLDYLHAALHSQNDEVHEVTLAVLLRGLRLNYVTADSLMQMISTEVFRRLSTSEVEGTVRDLSNVLTLIHQKEPTSPRLSAFLDGIFKCAAELLQSHAYSVVQAVGVAELVKKATDADVPVDRNLLHKCIAHVLQQKRKTTFVYDQGIWAAENCFKRGDYFGKEIMDALLEFPLSQGFYGQYEPYYSSKFYIQLGKEGQPRYKEFRRNYVQSVSRCQLFRSKEPFHNTDRIFHSAVDVYTLGWKVSKEERDRLSAFARFFFQNTRYWFSAARSNPFPVHYTYEECRNMWSFGFPKIEAGVLKTYLFTKGMEDFDVYRFNFNPAEVADMLTHSSVSMQIHHAYQSHGSVQEYFDVMANGFFEEMILQHLFTLPV